MVTPIRNLPRLKDIFGPDELKPSARPDAKAIIAEDSRPVVMGEPLAFDLSTVRRSRRHKTASATDAKPLPMSCYGEPMAIDRNAIRHSPGSTSGSLGADAKPCPLVQGESFPIAD